MRVSYYYVMTVRTFLIIQCESRHNSFEIIQNVLQPYHIAFLIHQAKCTSEIATSQSSNIAYILPIHTTKKLH